MAEPSVTLAAFLIDDKAGAGRFLEEIQRIDKADDNVRIVEAAIAERTRRGGIKIRQTGQVKQDDMGLPKGAMGATVLGVVVGTILLGPVGPAVGGVVGGTFVALHTRMQDIGIDKEFMKNASDAIERGQRALFVLYEGDWGASIGAIQDAVRAEKAKLIQSTLPAEKAEALEALVAPVVEELGGEETVADYEVDVAEAAVAAAAVSDDLTRIEGVSPAASAALTAAGVASYATLASTSEPDTRRVLTDAGVEPPDNVSTWAMQAAFAANGDWPGLDAYMRSSQPEAQEAPGGPAVQGDDLTQLSGIGPKAAAALVAAGYSTYADLAQANEPQIRHALHASELTPPGGVGSWPMQASYAARGDWQGLMKYNQKRTRATTPKAATAAAPAAAPDDLTQIKGIGPRVASVLADSGVTTYADLEHTGIDDLRSILSSRGILPPGNMDSWSAQAGYARRGDWEGLAAYNRR